MKLFSNVFETFRHKPISSWATAGGPWPPGFSYMEQVLNRGLKVLFFGLFSVCAPPAGGSCSVCLPPLLKFTALTCSVFVVVVVG